MTGRNEKKVLGLMWTFFGVGESQELKGDAGITE